MSIELKIRWDGEASGLSEHRLSIATFGEPLTLLVKALIRTASNLLSNAFEDSETGAKGGRLNKIAQGLDLQVKSIQGGCVNLVFECTQTPPPGGNFDMYNGIAHKALERLVDDIDEEQKGKATSNVARKYLRSIPESVRFQSYILSVDGEEIKKAEFGDVTLPEIPGQTPYLETVIGDVVGLGFSPGPTFIRVKQDKNTITMEASDSHIETAIHARGKAVECMCLVKEGKRSLLWIREELADKNISKPSEDEIKDHLFNRWDDLLKELAK